MVAPMRSAQFEAYIGRTSSPLHGCSPRRGEEIIVPMGLFLEEVYGGGDMVEG